MGDLHEILTIATTIFPKINGVRVKHVKKPDTTVRGIQSGQCDSVVLWAGKSCYLNGATYRYMTQ